MSRRIFWGDDEGPPDRLVGSPTEEAGFRGGVVEEDCDLVFAVGVSSVGPFLTPLAGADDDGEKQRGE